MAKKSEAVDVAPGPDDRSVRFPDGTVKTIPANWSLLPPGDAGLTRRVKATGPTWTVKEKKGRKVFSHGVWAADAQIEAAKASVEADRSDPAYAKRQASAAVRRDKKQAEYVEDFHGAVMAFLKFDTKYTSLAEKFAAAVTTHATPVGSGTVARTQRIPIEKRAESAVIAWMRHQTTAYDDMKIARVKGKRREVRRMLAEESRKRLQSYRRGAPIPPTCPLMQAIASSDDY